MSVICMHECTRIITSWENYNSDIFSLQLTTNSLWITVCILQKFPFNLQQFNYNKTKKESALIKQTCMVKEIVVNAFK